MKNSPENKKLPPDANVGYFLRLSESDLLVARVRQERHEEDAGTAGFSGQPEVFKKGNKQKAQYKEFTVRSTTPYVSWKAKKGWKICGVQSEGVVLENPAVSSLLLAEAGYTSGTKRGSRWPRALKPSRSRSPPRASGSRVRAVRGGRPSRSVRPARHGLLLKKK
ncbi:MAG: hypothetical protein R2687_03100 [Candidatus Nanopelagicales bacterium]